MRVPGDALAIAIRGESVLSGHADAPTLVLNPADDEAFAARVADLMAVGSTAPEDLQAELRDSYPGAVVRRRGLSAEPVEVWYVYREGHWIPPRR